MSRARTGRGGRVTTASRTRRAAAARATGARTDGRHGRGRAGYGRRGGACRCRCAPSPASGWGRPTSSAEPPARSGRGARDLDPAHRRDGLGLLADRPGHRRRGPRVVGPAGPCRGRRARRGRRHLRAGRPGAAARAARPRRAACCATPTSCRPRTGWPSASRAWAVAVTGLVHLARGLPAPADGADVMRDAGGMVGYLAASPLTTAPSRHGSRCPCCSSSRSSACSSSRPRPCTRSRSGCATCTTG